MRVLHEPRSFCFNTSVNFVSAVRAAVHPIKAGPHTFKGRRDLLILAAGQLQLLDHWLGHSVCFA